MKCSQWDQGGNLPPSNRRVGCQVNEGIAAPSQRQATAVHKENEVSNSLRPLR